MIRRAALLGTLCTFACAAPPPEEQSPLETEKTERPDVQAYADVGERSSTRLLFLSNTTPPTSPGQVFIDFGQPQWKDEYEDDFDELTRGKRWRFGKDSWTSLDSNVALSISGTEAAPGHYYLVLERAQDDQWYLVLLDPTPIRARRLDAFFAEEAPEGMKAPLRWQRTEETTGKLSVKLTPDEDDLHRALLEIRWGNHLLTANIDLRP